MELIDYEVIKDNKAKVVLPYLNLNEDEFKRYLEEMVRTELNMF